MQAWNWIRGYWSLHPEWEVGLTKSTAQRFPGTRHHSPCEQPCAVFGFLARTLHEYVESKSRNLTFKRLPITFLSSNEASVFRQVWLKSCGWKRRQRRRRPTLVWAGLKTIILLSTSSQTILSRWSYSHHSHVSTMRLEIIVRGSQPTWIQDEALTENKQSKRTFKNHGNTFFRLWWAQTKRGVFALSTSCYCLTICSMHSTSIFCPGTLVWKRRGNSSLPLLFFPQRWRSY